MGQDALKEAFRGVSTNGQVIRGLFPVRSTGVSTEPVKAAAEAFLAALTPEQRAASTFPVDDIEWRDWMNVHMYPRKGVSLKILDPRAARGRPCPDPRFAECPRRQDRRRHHEA